MFKIGHDFCNIDASFFLEFDLIKWNIIENAASGVRRKKFRGFKAMAGLVGGSGAEKFRKFAEIFLKKIAKMHYFRLILTKNFFNFN